MENMCCTHQHWATLFVAPTWMWSRRRTSGLRRPGSLRQVGPPSMFTPSVGWRPLLEQAQELLGRKTAHSLQVHPGTDLYKKIEKLVPWQLASVRAAYLPKAKRVKTGLEECHRASVMLTNDDSITVETEFLKDAQAPRERFVAPVRVAIFVLGYAPGEPDAPAPARQAAAQPAPEDEPVRDEVREGLEREGLVRQDLAGECWLSGGPLKPSEKSLAKALVRMHI